MREQGWHTGPHRAGLPGISRQIGLSNILPGRDTLALIIVIHHKQVSQNEEGVINVRLRTRTDTSAITLGSCRTK